MYLKKKRVIIFVTSYGETVSYPNLNNVFKTIDKHSRNTLCVDIIAKLLLFNYKLER